MAGITPSITTASFKPLELNEILMVPLALQAKEDQTQLALDELSLLESNSLDVDKGYVSGQIGAFKKEADVLSEELYTSGVGGNFVNKVKGLRKRKNNEFSLEGKTGQAAAAFNQFKVNEANIMKDPRLTADQKTLGLQEAKNNYTGVVEGGQYQDYVGAAHIGIQDKAYDIANKMTPQEIKRVTGVEMDANGYYRDNGYVYKDLPAKYIEKVIKQALEGDQDLMAYAQEMERLGISTVEEELTKAAENAGNVYQRKDRDYQSKMLPGNMQPTSLNPKQGRFDLNNWDTMPITYQDGIWNREFKLPSDKDVEGFFTKGSLTEANPLYNKEREADIKKRRASLKAAQKGRAITWKEKNEMLNTFDRMNPSYAKENEEKVALKESLDKLRNNNPVLAGNKNAVLNEDGSIKEPARPWTDREIFDLYKNGAKKAEKSMSLVVRPENPSSTFVAMSENLIGSGLRNGSFASKHMKIAGQKSGGKDIIASQMGIDNLDEFNTMIRTTGQVIGFSPGHPEMPGAFAVQVEILEDTGVYKKGDTPIIYMQNDGKPKQMLGNVSRMNDAIRNGENFSNKQVRGNGGAVVNEMVITELNPYSKTYEAGVIRSKTLYTKDELDQLTFKRATSPTGASILMAYNNDGSLVEPKVFKMTYDEEMQRGINRVTGHYDSVKNKKTLK
jgi:hypothetical protein